MVEEIDDVFPYDSDYWINSKHIGDEVNFIPKGCFEKIKGIIHSINPDGTCNIFKMNDMNAVEYYYEDVNLNRNDSELFKCGDKVNYWDGSKYNEGVFDRYVENKNNAKCYVGYTELDKYSKDMFMKDDGSRINVGDLVYTTDDYGNRIDFRVIKDVSNKEYEVRRLHSSRYPIEHILRRYLKDELVLVDIEKNGKWEKGWFLGIGKEGYQVRINANNTTFLRNKLKSVTLEYNQIKPYREESSNCTEENAFENDKKVIYKSKEHGWGIGTIKGNNGKTYTVINEKTNKEENDILPTNIRLYDNEYNPFYYRNDYVLCKNEKGGVEKRKLEEEFVRGNDYSLYLDNNQYNIHDRIEYSKYEGEIIKINHNHTYNILVDMKDKNCYFEMVDKSLIKAITTTPTIKMNSGENSLYVHNYQLYQQVKIKHENKWISGRINRIHNYLYDIYSSESRMLIKDVKYQEIYPCYFIDSTYRVGDRVLCKGNEYRIIQIVNDNTVKMISNDDKKEIKEVGVDEIELKDSLEYSVDEDIIYYHSEYRNVFDGIVTMKLENNKYVIKCSNTETYKNVKPEYMEKKGKSKSKFQTNDIVKVGKDDEGIIIRELEGKKIRELEGKKYLVYHKNDYEIIEEKRIEKVR